MKDRIIIISSEEGYRLLSYVCPQRKYYIPHGKIFFQMLRDINVKATLFVRARLKKEEEKI